MRPLQDCFISSAVVGILFTDLFTTSFCIFINSGGAGTSDKQVKVDGMIFFRFKDSKIIERWELIDILSAAKQLGVRQQLSAIKNAVLEYGEVKGNKQLGEKISGLFNKHLSTE